MSHGVDTDVSPYDSGSYASSTAYLTGMAAVKASNSMVRLITEKGAEYLGKEPEEVDFDGEQVFAKDGSASISLKDIGNRAMANNGKALEVTESHSSPVSPPPFMVGMAEIEMDKETCDFELVNYVAVVDCGTPINPAIVRVQTEGGLGQGIGMAMFEDVTRSEKGQVYENSFMQYKLPTRVDVGNIQVEFESSYEPTGPFGVKSIGEVVINTPSPAIAAAVAAATGIQIRELPITAEKIFRAKHEM